MIAVLSVEARKLNRSLASLLALAAPTLIAIFLFFNMLRGEKPPSWEMLLQGSTAIWAFFMLPMSVTALTALVAHMEHGPKSWDHLRGLPLPRWKIYAAKAVCVLAVVAMMSVATLGLTILAVKLAVMIKPVVEPTGPMELMRWIKVKGMMFGAALLMVAIQLWTALRYASFVPGLVVGIGGAFFAVVATSAKQGVFLPWQMPVNMLASEPWRVNTALGLGGGVGLLALIVLTVHLARREVL